MADQRFFTRVGPFTLAELARLSGAELRRAADEAKLFRDVAPLETATADEASFLENRKYLDAFRQSRAGAVFVDERAAEDAPPGMALLVSAEPYKAYARAAQAFYPAPAIACGRAPSALIDPTALVPQDCEIGPVRRYRGRRAAWSALPDRRQQRDRRRGRDRRRLHGLPPASRSATALIGARVVLHPGVRIGQAGFGFAPDQAGPVKVPQLGRVVIGDDVDIGANTHDRSRLRSRYRDRRGLDD